MRLFLVYREFGWVGLEAHGRHGLLRSQAVADPLRGRREIDVLGAGLLRMTRPVPNVPPLAPPPAPAVPGVGYLAWVVSALGITQIVAWGSLYYTIAVLAGPMAQGLGVSLATVYGAFSASLVVSGLCAPGIGRAIDRCGGRPVLAAGALASAAALALIALAPNIAVFYLGWALAGVAMAANLYDAAFAALSQTSGPRYRPALTALTLYGGFASTVFWPLTWYLEARLGWRTTLLAFAAVHLLVNLPLFLAALPRRAPAAAPAPAPTPGMPAATGGAQANSLFLWLATAFTVVSFVVSAIGAHAVSLLGASGLDAATAIAVASLFGPMQVAGRVAELAFARRLKATSVGVAAFVMMSVAMLLLAWAGGNVWLAFAFAASYGAANGVMTIVRGTVPAELLGRDAYGSLMGRLAQPAFLAKAIAPVLFAGLIAAGLGHDRLPYILVALAGCATLAFVLALRCARRADADGGTH